MKPMIERPKYLNQLIRLKDKDLIKVITGIRRCGKSTLFSIYCKYLKSIGIQEQQIICINLEDPEYYDFKDFRVLYDYIKEKLQPDMQNYIFIDEVQMVPDFQKAIDGLFLKDNCDVYITGSNAFLLSGELATLLAGRYIEIKMLPLSFKEFASCFQQIDAMKLYLQYIMNGSFPYIVELENKEDITAYLEGIYNTIVLKDVMARYRISDVTALENIIRFMFDNIGNVSSAAKIANTMTSAGRKISSPTVDIYLNALKESYVLYKVDRYDIKGKYYLTSGNKYYVSDLGLRSYLLGTKKMDVGHILENIVYLELLRRGYEVYVGKIGAAEVDFIAINGDGKEYYQVAYTVIDDNVLNRELASLEAIHDHNPKYLLTMDYTPPTSHNGIRQIQVLDWLLQ